MAATAISASLSSARSVPTAPTKHRPAGRPSVVFRRGAVTAGTPAADARWVSRSVARRSFSTVSPPASRNGAPPAVVGRTSTASARRSLRRSPAAETISRAARATPAVTALAIAKRPSTAGPSAPGCAATHLPCSRHASRACTVRKAATEPSNSAGSRSTASCRGAPRGRRAGGIHVTPRPQRRARPLAPRRAGRSSGRADFGPAGGRAGRPLPATPCPDRASTSPRCRRRARAGTAPRWRPPRASAGGRRAPGTTPAPGSTPPCRCRVRHRPGQGRLRPRTRCSSRRRACPEPPGWAVCRNARSGPQGCRRTRRCVRCLPRSPRRRAAPPTAAACRDCRCCSASQVGLPAPTACPATAKRSFTATVSPSSTPAAVGPTSGSPTMRHTDVSTAIGPGCCAVVSVVAAVSFAALRPWSAGATADPTAARAPAVPPARGRWCCAAAPDVLPWQRSPPARPPCAPSRSPSPPSG